MQPDPPTEPSPPQPSAADPDPAAPTAPTAPSAPAVPVWPSPPPPPPGWPQYAPVAATAIGPSRPGTITAAAIILIIFGVLITLFGLGFMLLGALFPSLQESPELADQLGTLPASFGTFVLVVGVIATAWGVAQIVAAIFVLSRRTWARITAMVVAILGALVGLASILPGEAGLTPVGASLSLLIVAGHAFAIWALASQGRWFNAPA